MIAGVKAAVGGIGFVLATPRVWPYAAVPLALLMLLTCGLGGLGLWGAGRAATALLGEGEGAWGQAGGWTLTVVLGLLAVLVAPLLAIVLAQPLSGFALEAIARAQAVALVGAAPPPTALGPAVWAATKITLVTLFAAVVFYGGLLVLDFAFPPVVVVTVPLKFLAGGWLLAWNFLDYPLTLHGLGVRARVEWVGRHFAAVTAFGLVWALLLLVPGLFFVLLPMGVAGATWLVVAAPPADSQSG